jgi:hypothetical protein
MTESQAHGFIWEKSVLEGVYGIFNTQQQGGSYTRKHDVPANENMIDHVNVSIKTAGGKSVDMGDARRVFDATMNEPISLLVLQYKQEGAEKVLKNVLEIDLTSSREELFGQVTLAEISELHDFLRGIPPGTASLGIREEYKQRAGKLNSKSGALQFRPKVDSKNQRRLQCSFPDIGAFCVRWPARIKSQNPTGIFKGVQLPLRILSTVRARLPR